MPHIPLKPFWQTSDEQTCKLYKGDVVSVLKRLPPKSVHCCITSPPYWGLRSYATGDAKHLEIGCEKTPEEFVANMVKVFREVKRVLRDDGTLWLNLGDTYCGGGAGGPGKSNDYAGSRHENRAHASSNLPSGNLVGIPWRVALALQANGWVLRSDIPWVKRAAMPESVTNRPAKALEYVFMFAKGKGYYYDAEAVRKESKTEWSSDCFLPDSEKDQHDNTFAASTASRKNRSSDIAPPGRNFRNADLWFESVSDPWGVVGVGEEIVGIDITSQGYDGAHFAVFPPKLIEPFVLAGTSEKGACDECGTPWRRIVEQKGGIRLDEENQGERDRSVARNRNGITGSLDGVPRKRETVGWEPMCKCGASVKPCVVLDPFVGSGTTAATSIRHGRYAIGIDLSEKYLRENAIPRIYETLTRSAHCKELVKPLGPARIAFG